MDFRMQDRMELKALVDSYATESDNPLQFFRILVVLLFGHGRRTWHF